MQSAISTLELDETTIQSKVNNITTSPSGSETSFTTTSSVRKRISLGENFTFETTRMVATINETNELSGAKSMFVDLTLSATNVNVPVIDLDRASMNLIANRINIDSSSDVFQQDFNASTEPDGDQNAYISNKKDCT